MIPMLDVAWVMFAFLLGACAAVPVVRAWDRYRAVTGRRVLRTAKREYANRLLLRQAELVSRGFNENEALRAAKRELQEEAHKTTTIFQREGIE